MRGYGLPRITDVEFPDVGDIRCYSLNMQPESGRTSSRRRRSSRRTWKRRYRQFQKRRLRRRRSSRRTWKRRYRQFQKRRLRGLHTRRYGRRVI